MEQLNVAPPDPVAELLHEVNVRSSVYCLSELRAPWGFAVEGATVAKFHLVLEGSCWLDLDGQPPARLGEGDLVILAGGQPHTMRDEPHSAVVGLDLLIADHPLDASARLRCGGDGPVTRLLCGGFVLAEAGSARLLRLLPPVLRLDSASTSLGAWIDPVFALVRSEADHAAPGAQAIFAKLADVFLAQALRTYLTGLKHTGLLQPAPAADPRIEQVTALLRDQPARQWTLQALAREAGMSRTLLTARFRAATGESPMRHLAKVRLGQAAGYLVTNNMSIEAIAHRTGYATTASLSKAFKREFGVSPGSYRRTKGASSIGPAR